MRGYTMVVCLTDAGAFVPKLLVPLPEAVIQEAITPGTFSVFVRRRNRTTGETIALDRKHFSPEALKDSSDGLSQGFRPVRAAYPCNAQGEPVAKAMMVALEMPYGPLDHLSALGGQASGPYNDFVKMDICVTQKAPIPGAPTCRGLVFRHREDALCRELEGWQFRHTVDEAHPLRYGFFTPNLVAGEKKPLLVWLHGAGGGGTDPRYPVVGNRVTGFSSPQGQAALGGAWVLVPQCPTMWMDDGRGTPLMENNDSIYVQTVKKAVDTFLEEHRDSIDRRQIWIAGNSNGGFMTVLQAMCYPDFYAAAVPVCQAVVEAYVTEDQIEAMKQVPVWFVHCKGDFVVDPARTVLPLYHRLLRAGAREVHFTYLDRIEDETGCFYNRDGTPYTYIPHFAWVPVYNNACRVDLDGSPVMKSGTAVGIFEWLRETKRDKEKQNAECCDF